MVALALVIVGAVRASEVEVRAVEIVQQLLGAGRIEEAGSLLSELRAAGDASAETLFLSGLAARALGEPESSIAYLRAAVDAAPELPRIRLEYARALFDARRDIEAASEFKAVLRQGVPRPVRRNVERFLTELERRRLWVVAVSASAVPDSNPSGATSAQTVQLFGLPFQLEPDARARSGTGAQLRLMGELRHPVSEDDSLFASVSVDETQYEGRDWDDRQVRTALGARLERGRSEVALAPGLRWYGGKLYEKTVGVRGSTGFALAPFVYLSLSAEPHRRIVENYGRTRSWVLPLAATVSVRAAEDLVVGVKSLVKREVDDVAVSTHWDLAAGPFVRASFLGLIAEADLLVGARRFANGQGYQLDPRADRWWNASLVVSHEDLVIADLRPYVGVARDSVDSNNELFSYERTRLLFGLRGAF